ncbi:MAG: hypothetical protein HZB59_11190 [Ignavibacteriales bacterium]|nr:hypothetical protein [Ignavibacteriales bacterium]
MAKYFLDSEARALLMRLAQLRPFSLTMPMVPSAAISHAAQNAIENHMIIVHTKLRSSVDKFIQWLQSPEGRNAPAEEAQRRFCTLKLSFNNVLTHFDIFADVISQRSEHGTGVWIAGLDNLATDALQLPGNFFKPPPVVCYVDRGIGAAIRRVKTRLPGGSENPVAIIRVPRERLVGYGIASSLVHEVGHQASALLDLVNSIKPELQERQLRAGPEKFAWMLFERWISEILADFWSVAKVGITASMGLIGVVSLPRVFVFRLDTEDPHPMPFLRVMISCAIGQAMYPHPQWTQLAALWSAMYPFSGLEQDKIKIIKTIQAQIPDLVKILLNHCPKTLMGHSLRSIMEVEQRRPEKLMYYFYSWKSMPHRMREVSPTLAFAVIGQARTSGKLTAEIESKILSNMLTYWAANSAVPTSDNYNKKIIYSKLLIGEQL